MKITVVDKISNQMLTYTCDRYKLQEGSLILINVVTDDDTRYDEIGFSIGNGLQWLVSEKPAPDFSLY